MNTKKLQSNLESEINTLLKRKIPSYDISNLCINLSDSHIQDVIIKLGGILIFEKPKKTSVYPTCLFKIFKINKEGKLYYGYKL